MSWYVLEGPDGGGKTTFAKALQKAGWRYERCTIKDELPKLARRMVTLHDEPKVVWDRAHISEAVYHPERINWGWFDMIEGYLEEQRAICVKFMVQHRNRQPDWKKQHQAFTNSFQLESNLRWVDAGIFSWESNKALVVLK